MRIEARDVFAVEIEGGHNRLEYVPANAVSTVCNIILCGDEDKDDLYFCGECRRPF